MKSDNDNEIKSRGVDMECERCPECGGYPIRVDHLFALKKTRKRRHNGKIRVVNKECRSYYHCQCGHCVTGWQKPKYNRKNEVIRDAWLLARDAWQKKKFIKSDA